MHPAPEPRIEIFLAQIRRLHDVHVAVDEPEPVFHDILLAWLSTSRARLTGPPLPLGTLPGRLLPPPAGGCAARPVLPRSPPFWGGGAEGGRSPPPSLTPAPARSSL